MTIKKIAEKIRGEKKFSKGGEKYHQTYMVVEEEGVKRLVPDDLVDIQAEIQSHAASVDFKSLIARYMNGDETAINRAQAFYADVSKIPKNMQEVLAINSRGKQIFEEMPREVKEIYDYNYYEFIRNPQLLDEYIQSKNIEDVPVVETEEVKESE